MFAKLHIQNNDDKPRVGMNVAFKAEAFPALAGIPAQITHIWPRFRSGDFLVTLEFEQPVRTKEGPILHIDAFASELDYRPHSRA